MKPAEIKAAASERAGLSDFGDDHFEAPLKLWADGLTSDRLSEFGRAFLARQAVADLVRRLQIVDTLKRHPEIADVTLPPILYISGHERSGTTLLHNLLMLHPKARALLRWELVRPTPPPEAATYAIDPRIAATQKTIDGLRGSLLEHMHWVNADDPEECIFGFYNMSGILGGAPAFAMPHWAEWLVCRQPEAAFREYRMLIKLLLWRNPVPDGGHLVLKSPQIAKQLPLWLRVFPEAQMILTHRDPFRTSTSTATLISHINQPFVTDAISGDETLMADYVTMLTETKCAALVDFDDTAAVKPVNVRYDALVSDAAGVITSLQDQSGVAHWPNLKADVADFLAAQNRAKPPRRMPTFGLEHEAFLARPEVAAYCQHFGLAPERRRVTG